MIIMINQTPLESMDEQNQFDARGIRAITEVVTEMAMSTEKLNMDKDVAIKDIDATAEQQKLEIEQNLAFKQAEQQKNIITFTAEQEAETTKFQYQMEQGV